jgi:hypothetical protein
MLLAYCSGNDKYKTESIRVEMSNLVCDQIEGKITCYSKLPNWAKINNCILQEITSDMLW